MRSRQCSGEALGSPGSAACCAFLPGFTSAVPRLNTWLMRGLWWVDGLGMIHDGLVMGTDGLVMINHG